MGATMHHGRARSGHDVLRASPKGDVDRRSQSVGRHIAPRSTTNPDQPTFHRCDKAATGDIYIDGSLAERSTALARAMARMAGTDASGPYHPIDRMARFGNRRRHRSQTLADRSRAGSLHGCRLPATRSAFSRPAVSPRHRGSASHHVQSPRRNFGRTR